MKEEPNFDWLSAFKRGLTSGFNHYYNLHYQRIRYYTLQLTGNRQESEDITIETFIKLSRLYDRFNTEHEIKAFLYITARNSCIDYLRRLKRQKTSPFDFSDNERIQFGSELTVDDTSDLVVMEAEMLEKMYKAIEALPPKCKEIFKLIYYHGMSTDSIAQQCSITQDTVRSHKRRAIELLRIQLLDKHDSGAFVWMLICAIGYWQ